MVSNNFGNQPVSLAAGDNIPRIPQIYPVSRLANLYDMSGNRTNISTTSNTRNPLNRTNGLSFKDKLKRNSNQSQDLNIQEDLNSNDNQKTSDYTSTSFLSRPDSIKPGNTIGQTGSESRTIQPDVISSNLSSVPQLGSQSMNPGFAAEQLRKSMNRILSSMNSKNPQENNSQLVGETIVENPQEYEEPQVIVNPQFQSKFYKTDENARRDLLEHLLNQANKRAVNLKKDVFRDQIISQPITYDPIKQEQQIVNQNINQNKSSDLHANIIGSTALQANINDYRQKLLDNIQDSISKSYARQLDIINKNNQDRVEFENKQIEKENAAAMLELEKKKLDDAERVKLILDSIYGNETDNQINDQNARTQAALEIQQFTQEYVDKNTKEALKAKMEAEEEKAKLLERYQNDLSKTNTDEERARLLKTYEPLIKQANDKIEEINKKYESLKSEYEKKAQLLFAQEMQRRQMELRGARPGEYFRTVNKYDPDISVYRELNSGRKFSKGGLTLEERKELETHKAKLRQLEKKSKKELSIQDKVYLQERKAAIEREKSILENTKKRINRLLDKLANIK